MFGYRAVKASPSNELPPSHRTSLVTWSRTDGSFAISAIANVNAAAVVSIPAMNRRNRAIHSDGSPEAPERAVVDLKSIRLLGAQKSPYSYVNVQNGHKSPQLCAAPRMRR